MTLTTMTAPAPPRETTLRDYLRQEPEADHRKIDTAFGQLDLTKPNDLAHFLRAHFLALSLLEPFLRNAAELPPMDSRLHLIQADLVILGDRCPELPAREVAALHPLGAAYVVAGSSLGQRVLRRHWARSGDPDVRQAGRFLGDDSLTPYWKALQSELAQPSHERPDTPAILEAARRTFALYEDMLGLTAYRQL